MLALTAQQHLLLQVTKYIVINKETIMAMSEAVMDWLNEDTINGTDFIDSEGREVEIAQDYDCNSCGKSDYMCSC